MKVNFINTGVPHAVVSSTNYLRKYSDREKEDSTERTLRLIKKDFLQFPRVVYLGNHSRLSSEKNIVKIKRIYVPESVERRDLTAQLIGVLSGE